MELIKTAKTYSRQLEQLSEEVVLEVKKLVDEYCTASAAITTAENRPVVEYPRVPVRAW